MGLPWDDLFPDDYMRGPRLTAWEALLGAKVFWLIIRTDEHTSARAALRRQLAEQTDETARERIQELIQAHTKAIDEAGKEQAVLAGADAKAKKALVKKNVEAWITALRSRAKDYRRYSDEERKAAGAATTAQDRQRHEANEKADRDEANHYERMAGELASDLAEAKL